MGGAARPHASPVRRPYGRPRGSVGGGPRRRRRPRARGPARRSTRSEGAEGSDGYRQAPTPLTETPGRRKANPKFSQHSAKGGGAQKSGTPARATRPHQKNLSRERGQRVPTGTHATSPAPQGGGRQTQNLPSTPSRERVRRQHHRDLRTGEKSTPRKAEVQGSNGTRPKASTPPRVMPHMHPRKAEGKSKICPALRLGKGARKSSTRARATRTHQKTPSTGEENSTPRRADVRTSNGAWRKMPALRLGRGMRRSDAGCGACGARVQPADGRGPEWDGQHGQASRKKTEGGWQRNAQHSACAPGMEGRLKRAGRGYDPAPGRMARSSPTGADR